MSAATASRLVSKNSNCAIVVYDGAPYSVAIEIITPSLATMYLGLNTANRAVKVRHVDRLVTTMSSGSWQLNGEPIIFSDDGRLLDGQHRLHAVIKSNKSLPMFVIRGINDNVFDTIDTGSKRTGGDVFSSLGIPNANSVAALLNVGHILLSGCDLSDLRQRVTNPRDVYELYEEELLQRAHHAATSVRRLLTPSIAGGLYMLFSIKSSASHDVAKVDEFFKSLSTGENLSKNNPILVLRNKLSEFYLNKRQKQTPKFLAAITIKAWNAYMQDQEIARLSFNYEFEKFPVPI